MEQTVTCYNRQIDKLACIGCRHHWSPNTILYALFLKIIDRLITLLRFDKSNYFKFYAMRWALFRVPKTIQFACMP